MAVNGLHLPFELLSDAEFHLCRGLRLPSFKAAGQRLLRRLTLVVRDGVIVKLHYPVFPSEEDVAWVLSWLVVNQAGPCDQTFEPRPPKRGLVDFRKRSVESAG